MNPALSSPARASLRRATWIRFAAAAAAFACAACFWDVEKVAGGGIETGNTGSLTGRVLTDAGRPIPGADVILAEVKLTGDGPVSVTEHMIATDDSGRYHFDSLPEGRYAIYAPGKGDGRLSAIQTRIHKPQGDLGFPILPRGLR